MTRPPLGVLLLTAPLWLALGAVSWLALALTGWGTETEPVDQLVRDLGPLALSAGFGVLAVWVVVRLVDAPRWWSLAGALPALVASASYFTTAW